jgi:hypothetical protein
MKGMHNERITTTAVARRLNLSAARVRQLADAGCLQCTPTDRGRLFDPDVVAEYAATRARYTRLPCPTHRSHTRSSVPAGDRGRAR